MSLKTDLDFETKETKELLSKLDFGYFLKEHLAVETYSQEQIDTIYNSFEETMATLKKRAKKNKKQFIYFLEGQNRKAFTGGFLPAMFHLDKSRSHHFSDFEAVGETWAYFKFWADHYKKKLTRKKVWELITKIGSLLAILLSLIKIWELFHSR